MWGGGDYSLHTIGAKHVIDNTGELALEALDAIDVAAQAGSFQLADFGAADGGTSIDLVRRIIGNVRVRAPSRPICMTYTDLPRNDYSALFNLVHGGRPDVKSYLDEYDNVFVYASGTSFYLPIFPAETLDFGFSATAMHWISGMPGRITDHVHAVGAKGEELEAFRRHALADWDTILLNRARELKPGGRLVMSNFCIDAQGRYLGNTGGLNMFDTFNRLWRRLVEAGAITEAEYQNTAFPQFYKTVEEYCGPLTDPASAVHQAGLRLESAETRVVPCPYAARFAETGDLERFAVSYVPTLRTWSETVFFNSLDMERPEEERREIVERFYQSYVDLVREDPTGHAMDYVHIYMVVSKE
jgi:SAM-dependent methyltransferase